MKNAIFAGFFGLLAIGAAVGAAVAKTPGVWLGFGLLFALFALLAYAFAEFAAEGRGE